MLLERIEKNLKKIQENINKDNFIFDFLEAFEQPKASIKRIKEGKTISLIPIRIFHQHTLNPTRSTNINNYEKDLKRLYELHPELTGKLDNVVLRGIVSDENSYFVPDENAAINYSSAISCLPIDNFKKVAYRPKYSYRNNIWNIRKILNKN
jgi:hypothetical protein